MLTGCARPEPFRELALKNPLGLNGTNLFIDLDGEGQGFAKWYHLIDVPLFSPVALERIVEARLDLGMGRLWLTPKSLPPELGGVVEWPDSLLLTGVLWRLSLRDGQREWVIAKTVEASTALARESCWRTSCAYGVAADVGGEHLLGLRLLTEDLNSRPPGWPAPLTRLTLEFSLGIELLLPPDSPLDGVGFAGEFQLRGGDLTLTILD